MSNVAIIGKGAAAAAVLGALVEYTPATTVHWLGCDTAVGRGAAYAADEFGGLLNVRASGMRLSPDHPTGFLTDVAQRHPGTSAAAFVPRAWFGDYIAREISRFRDQAQTKGQSVQLYPARATQLQALPAGGYAIGTNDAGQIYADAVILATGALPAQALPGVSKMALSSGRYHLDPLQVGEQPLAPRRIVVIGSGLTAIDTLVDAARRWPAAQLIAISRHGRFPAIHDPEAAAPYASQAVLNAQLLADPRPARVLRAIRAAADQAEAWPAVIDGMRPINSRLWQAWSPSQRGMFLRHLRSIWDRARHRIPPASAAQIHQLLQSGRLQIQAARLRAVSGAGPLQLELAPSDGKSMRSLQADLVFQACGFNTRVEGCCDPLLQQMTQTGLLTPAANGLGIHTTPEGQLLDPQQRPLAGLYTLGAMLRGTLWECTAMPEITATAQALAQRLARHLSASTAPSAPLDG